MGIYALLAILKKKQNIQIVDLENEVLEEQLESGLSTSNIKRKREGKETIENSKGVRKTVNHTKNSKRIKILKTSKETTTQKDTIKIKNKFAEESLEDINALVLQPKRIRTEEQMSLEFEKQLQKEGISNFPFKFEHLNK